MDLPLFATLARNNNNYINNNSNNNNFIQVSNVFSTVVLIGESLQLLLEIK